MVGGADRDPEMFDRPDEFNLQGRDAVDIFVWSLAFNSALGARLARMETCCAIEVLLDRNPEVSFRPEESSPPFGHEFRKPQQLIVGWAGLRWRRPE